MRRSKSEEFKEAINERCVVYSYDKSHVIGRGRFAVVFPGTLSLIGDESNSMPCVVRDVVAEQNEYDHKNERKIHALLTRGLSSKSAGVVKFFNHGATTNYSRFLLSQCDATLDVVIEKIRELVHTRPRSETRYIDCFFMELLLSMRRALKNLARHSIVHADIKPQNIGVKLDPETGELYCVLLDLGSARYHDQVHREKNKLHGSPLYMAPEICDAFGNTTNAPVSPLSAPSAVDVFSFGMVLSAILNESRHSLPSKITMPKLGLFDFAYIASQGMHYQTVRHDAQSAPSVTQEAILKRLLSLPLKECLHELIESMREVLPENRINLETLDAVIDRFERGFSEEKSKMTSENKEKMRLLYRELITPPAKNSDDDNEWSFSTSEVLEAAAKLSHAGTLTR